MTRLEALERAVLKLRKWAKKHEPGPSFDGFTQGLETASDDISIILDKADKDSEEGNANPKE